MSNRRKVKETLLLAATALAVGAGVVYAFLPKAVPVDTASVTRGSLEVTVRDDGRTRIKNRYLISAPLAGQLQRVLFKPGAPVTAGDALAVIEPTDSDLLDPRSYAAAEARVRAAEETVKQANAVLERTLAGFDYARNDLKRVKELFQTKMVSSQELERAELAARTSEGDLNSARFGARVAEYELELARTVLERRAPGNGGGRVDICAPIAGKVLRVLQESAVVVAPGTPLVELGDPQDLEVEIDVLSTDAVRIRPGSRVSLDYWGGPRTLEARVRLVEPAGFLKISALGVEEQRVWVIADFISPRSEWQTLGDAYRIEASIVTWETNNVAKIPAGALVRQQDDWAVFKIAQNRAHLQVIQIGHRSENEAEILGGLVEGDRVILYPSDRISSGVRVKMRKTEH